jgi:hypothetical protein
LLGSDVQLIPPVLSTSGSFITQHGVAPEGSGLLDGQRRTSPLGQSEELPHNPEQSAFQSGLDSVANNVGESGDMADITELVSETKTHRRDRILNEGSDVQHW